MNIILFNNCHKEQYCNKNSCMYIIMYLCFSINITFSKKWIAEKCIHILNIIGAARLSYQRPLLFIFQLARIREWMLPHSLLYIMYYVSYIIFLTTSESEYLSVGFLVLWIYSSLNWHIIFLIIQVYLNCLHFCFNLPEILINDNINSFVIFAIKYLQNLWFAYKMHFVLQWDKPAYWHF